MDMFATPSTAFKLPLHIVGLAYQFAEAPSPPLLHTRPFNKLVLDFLDVEAKQGKDNDRDDSLSHWLRVMDLEIRATCFVLIWTSEWVFYFVYIFFLQIHHSIHVLFCVVSYSLYWHLMLNHLETILWDFSWEIHSFTPLRSTRHLV